MLETQKGVTPANPFRSHTHTHTLHPCTTHASVLGVIWEDVSTNTSHLLHAAFRQARMKSNFQAQSTKHKAQSTEQARVCVSVGFATATAHHQARSALTTAMTGARTAESAGPSLEIAHTCSVANAGAGSSSAGGSLDQTRFGHCKPKLAAGVDDSTTSPKLLLTTLLLYCHARP